MTVTRTLRPGTALPDGRAVLTLLKPVTWFPPMWAYVCGIVAAGQPLGERWAYIPLGLVLTGPIVCAASQATNDWFDREVDAINEPHRPIPSGRIPGQWGLAIALAWTVLSLVASIPLGAWGIGATVVALILSWMYSAPPFRLKRNGWFGNAAVGFTYEGLAWVTGTAVMLGGRAPATEVLVIAALYSIGAHGIMTLNDFKSIDGDRRVGLGSLPARLGPHRAGVVACATMAGAQAIVVALLFSWDRPWQGAIVAAVLVAQLPLMRRWLAQPRELAPWYNQTGVSLFVSGMMAAAVALRPLADATP